MIDVYVLIRRKGKKLVLSTRSLGGAKKKEEAQGQRKVEIKILCSLLWY